MYKTLQCIPKILSVYEDVNASTAMYDASINFAIVTLKLIYKTTEYGSNREYEVDMR